MERPELPLSPEIEERLVELFTDSPLNDEPFTPEEEERIRRHLARREENRRQLQ